MNHFKLDRESFQNLLAGAFTVQHALSDAQSPSVIHALQHLIITRQLSLNMAMRLIAGCARNVADATGVAIGLLESNQLGYVAGSGSAAAWIGRRVSATLCVAGLASNNVEILRVEDAEKETRIEAAICRQFGAKALLILPICRDQALAGVIKIIFSNAHGFHDREVSAYHSMADLAGEALTSRLEKAAGKSTLTTPSGMEQRALHYENLLGKLKTVPNVGFSDPARRLVTESEKVGVVQGTARPISPVEAPTEPPTLRLQWWKFADPAAVIIVLITAGWIAYGSVHSVSSFTSSARQTQDPHQQQELLFSAKSQVIDRATEQPETILPEGVVKSARRTPRRVVIGNQEIEYVSDDVTVRRFIPIAVKPIKGPADSRVR